MASLTYQTLSYMVLVHGLGRAILASRSDSRPPKAALVKVEKELRHRELKIQVTTINHLEQEWLTITIECHYSSYPAHKVRRVISCPVDMTQVYF